jgi:hypothetical protein
MRTRRFVCPAALVTVCLAAGACSRLMKDDPATESGPEPTAAATDAEAQAFAAELERAVQSGKQERALQEFSLEVVGHRVVAGLPMAEDKKAEVLKLVPNRVPAHNIVNRMVTEANRTGGFKLVRVRPAGGRHVATFRLGIGEGPLLYFELVIARFPSGRVGVEDLISLHDGERLTDAVRFHVLPAATLRDPELAAKLTDDDRLFLAHKAKALEFFQTADAGKAGEAITLYMRLPAELRDRKVVLLKYARACFQAGAAERKTALDTCRRRFPGEPGVDMLALLYHFDRREFKAALEPLDALRESVGEDALLEGFRAGLLAETGKLPAARAAAERAVAIDPERKLGYLAGVLAALRAGDHADLLAWMKRTVERTGYDFADLLRDPDFAAFVQSPQYAEWKTWRANWPPR